MIADDEEAAAGTITARPLGAGEVRTAYDRPGRKLTSTGVPGTHYLTSRGILGTRLRCFEPLALSSEIELAFLWRTDVPRGGLGMPAGRRRFFRVEPVTECSARRGG
jgi:hypothetical protein